MKKLFSLMILALLIGLLPLAAAAQDPGAVESIEDVVDDPAPAQAAPAPRTVPEKVLYDNGPLITHPGGGAGGADISAVQTALGMLTYAFGHQFDYGYRIADDFEITDPGGWELGAIQFYAYQTNSPADPSPITQVNYRIWDGQPGAGGSVLCGNRVTNMLVSTVWSNIYRVLDTYPNSSARPVMEDTVRIHAACTHLEPGTYWLDWQSDGSLSSGPWAPPITILGQTTTGNGLQSLNNGRIWWPVKDSGSRTPQGFPFRILGPEISLVPEDQAGSVPPGSSDDFGLDLLNLTGAEESVDLAYTATGPGACYGPAASPPIPNGDVWPFQVSVEVDPGATPGDIVDCEIYAAGQSSGDDDTAWIHVAARFPIFATHVRILPVPGESWLLGVIRIVDAALQPVPGAVVRARWMGPSGPIIVQLRRTGQSGLALPVMAYQGPGTYYLHLLGVTAPGYVYVREMNWESSASWTAPLGTTGGGPRSLRLSCRASRHLFIRPPLCGVVVLTAAG